LFQEEYFIDKSSNTFADNLAAFGLAFVLNAIVDGRAKIRLEDRGGAFAAICEPALKPEWVERRKFFVGAPFLVTTKDGVKLIKGTLLNPADFMTGGDTAADYEEEKQVRAEFFAQRELLSKEARRVLAEGKSQAEIAALRQPHMHWEIFRAVNPAALQGYNGLMAEWWRGQGKVFPEMLKVLFQMTAQTPNNIDGAEKTWAKLGKTHGWKSKDATAIQLFNPAQGKGVNNSKAEWSPPNNVKGFWLLEWLRAIGLFHGGLTRIVANPKDPRNAKDRKTYVIAPVSLEWNRHLEVMKDFRQTMAGSATAVKLDILAALRYTQAFLKHYEGARVEDIATELFGRRPADLVSGMQMAFYKSLRNAIATMNIASINLPRWVRLGTPDALARLGEALREHASIVNGLDETRGDQFELLAHYRDFLSANDPDPFFEFTTAYSGFIINQRERGKYVRQFTTTTLEVLFMNSDDQPIFSQILQSEGFKNLAYAIRHSTVVPQSRKKRGKPVVDVRYGLGQQLARKAAYPAEFLAELTEFLHLYNAENAQLRENNRNPFRKNVTTADIEAIAALVDQFGSKVVCNMLVAYGYAREPYEGKDEGEPTPAVVDAPEADVDAGDGDNSEEN